MCLMSVMIKQKDRLQIVKKVLKELDAHEKQIITVLNKIDCLTYSETLDHLERETNPCVAISAKTGQNMERLFEVLSENTKEYRTFERLFIPYSHHNLVSKIYKKWKCQKTKEL